MGPLTPQMEQLATLASVSDGKTPESKQGNSPDIGAASSGSATRASHVSGRAGQVKAFSGKGHTLSSSRADQPKGVSGASKEDPILHTARVIAERALGTLRENEFKLLQQARYL